MNHTNIPNWLAQAIEAERIIREQIKRLEGEGYVLIPGTCIWEKKDADGNVVANFSL